MTSRSGTDLSSYTHHIMILPKNKGSFMPDCNWAGLGTMGTLRTDTGGTFGRVWLSGVDDNMLEVMMLKDM